MPEPETLQGLRLGVGAFKLTRNTDPKGPYLRLLIPEKALKSHNREYLGPLGEQNAATRASHRLKRQGAGSSPKYKYLKFPL